MVEGAKKKKEEKKNLLTGMRPGGFEPPTFGSGIRRAAVAPWPQQIHMFYICIIYVLCVCVFRIRDLNPGRLGENQVS